jgi:hypothetical protein
MNRFNLIAWLVCTTLTCVAATRRPSGLMSGDPFMGDWKITLTPSGSDANSPGVKQFDETLTFTGDKLSAKTLGADHGFKPGGYNEDVRAYGPAKFDSTQESDKEGHIAWTGTEDGGQLTGTMVWTKKDGKEIHYDFQGSKSGQ